MKRNGIGVRRHAAAPSTVHAIRGLRASNISDEGRRQKQEALVTHVNVKG